MFSISALPILNASLNFTAAVLIGAGYYFIRHKKTQAHKTCMIAALVVSTLFLIPYLLYHYNVGSVPFQHQGWIRPVYFFILITHVVLSITVVPLALTSFYFAFTHAFGRHRRLNRVFLPIWLYVSVTGVVIFLLLRA